MSGPIKLLLPAVIVLGVIACTGSDEPDAMATADTWRVASESSVEVTRRSGNGDPDAALAALSGDAREAALELLAGAKKQRLEAAEWLGKAIETEKQARAYHAGGDEQSAASARETAADCRRRAKEILARARADEARVMALARETAAGERP